MPICAWIVFAGTTMYSLGTYVHTLKCTFTTIWVHLDLKMRAAVNGKKKKKKKQSKKWK